MPYVPPALRKRGIQPKKITQFKPKQKEVKTISKVELFENMRKDHYGKADAAWLEPDPGMPSPNQPEE